MSHSPVRQRLTPVGIALIYSVFGGLWIFFSDPVLAALTSSPSTFRIAALLSDWCFIVVSAQILYLMIRRHESVIDNSARSLVKVNRALKVFSACNRAITRESQEPELLQAICRIFVEVGGYRLAWVGEPRQDEERTLAPVARWGDGQGYIDSLRVSWGPGELGQGPAGTAIRTGRTTVVQNIPSNPRFKPWREDALRQGFASAISLPLTEHGLPFAVLTILAGEADAFNEAEVSLLEELAEELSYGLRSLRLKGEREREKEEQKLLIAVIEQGSEGVLTCDADGTIQYMNPAFEHLCGLSSRVDVGRNLRTFRTCDAEGFFAEMLEAIDEGQGRTCFFISPGLDGQQGRIDARISPVRDSAGEIARYVAILRDVTQENRLQEQLRRAQKMEAIATLAGGIAHDFNNILASILTNAEMTLEDVEGIEAAREQLEVVLKAARRGRDLVRQILTLSCRGEQESRPVRVDEILQECLHLLRASLPSTIEIRRRITGTIGSVCADPTQIHQVIMNLCTNAADAMVEGAGLLDIRLEEVSCVAGSEHSSAGMTQGRYLRLSVSDTGQGMDRAVLERIFDPFYSTKKPGRGTGLGLSVVQGIVQNHRGVLTVHSEPGKGSVFHVFLPCIGPAQVAPSGGCGAPQRGGGERILMVDDEEDLALAARRMLEKLGYRVTAVCDSLEALHLFQARPDGFDLLVTDLTMPHLTGEALAARLRSLRPELPVVLCSGLGAAAEWMPGRGGGVSEVVDAFVMKPFERQELAAVIRRVLDEGPGRLRSVEAFAWPGC